jgi:alginate O-acetyltransferase complex protein AlgI
MLFTEPAFLFFFWPILLLAYPLLGIGGRNLLLLAASLLFYWWGEKLFFVMVGSVLMNWAFGLFVDRVRYPRLAPWAMGAAVAANLILLGIYKYANFLVEQWNGLLLMGGFAPVAWKDISLPIGISFFTFHSLSYVVDVWRGHAEAQRNPAKIGLYLSLFPQLVAGPIVRYHEIKDQFEVRQIRLADITEGCRRVIIGLGKKMLIANSVALAADRCFDAAPGTLSTAAAWLGVVCYTLQLYFDFSAYSDMAVGLARIMGFRFPENFNHPYAARSVQDFWHRWHMTLSRFFRDYLYIPLGGNRVAPWKVYRNLLLVFVLCGFWHGASWNFLLWGLWHGVFLVLERGAWGRAIGALPYLPGWVYAQLVWLLSMVLFRAADLQASSTYFVALAGLQPPGGIGAADVLSSQVVLGLLAGLLCATPGPLRWIVARIEGAGAASLLPWLQAVALLLITVVSVILIAGGAYSPFLYQQF